MGVDEYLWKLDLTQTFPARIPPWELEEKPSSPTAHYNGAEGTIWSIGTGTFVTVGGWFPPYHGPFGDLYGAPYFDAAQNFQLPAPRMFTYHAGTRNWTSVPLDNGAGLQRISTASWASSPRLRRGYVLGGLFITESSQGPPYPVTDTWLDTMTQYDFATQKWRTEDLPPEIGLTVDGGLLALDRVGKDGVLLFLGGEHRDQNGTSSVPSDDIFARRSMDTIWVYDIASSNWHAQPASGDIPPGRRQSCFFTVPAPDLSSYQIYTFSGTLAQEVTLFDLYVLTVPGFIWARVPLTSATYPYPLHGMNAHQCSPHADGRQVLIVPGNINASTPQTAPAFEYTCNNGTGVRIFDTQTWVFRETFDPTLTELGVPAPIVDLIGGTASGAAKVTTPSAGWQEKALGDIFAKRNKPIVYDDTDNTTTTTNTTNSGGDTGGVPGPLSGISKTTIAGIGAGVAIAVAAVLVVFCCSCGKWKRARRERRTAAAAVELSARGDPAEVPAVVPGELGPGTCRGELDGGWGPPAELMGYGDAVKAKQEEEYVRVGVEEYEHGIQQVGMHSPPYVYRDTEVEGWGDHERTRTHW